MVTISATLERLPVVDATEPPRGRTWLIEGGLPLRGEVTIGGHTWRTTPGVYDGVGYVVVNRSVKAATGVDAPDRVSVEMDVDTEPRTVRVPADLRDALRADDAAWKSFQKLSFSHRREYAEWVEEAKRPETRARRIAATLERAAKGLPQR